tara:strand:+ start:4939 stop:5628 length:690 start_codon:yes stop_codon:yes gene_type:complete
MVKKITKKSLDGIHRGNTRTGVITSPSSVCTIPIDSKTIDAVYFKFVKPFIDKSPLYIGSVNDLLPIYESIVEQMETIPMGNVRSTLLVFKDMLTIIICAQQNYFDYIRCQNELKSLREKYNLSQETIYELEQKIIFLEKDEEERNITTGFIKGTLGITVKKLKPMIYTQALLDLDVAWFKYLHNYANFEPSLFISTQNYVKSLGTKEEAYNELIRLLDEKYADYLDDE